MNWREFGMTKSRCDSKYCREIYMEGLWKNMRKFSHSNKSADRYFRPGPMRHGRVGRERPEEQRRKENNEI
jgi:hypothetical protein